MAAPSVNLMEFDEGGTERPLTRAETTRALFAAANVPANRDIRNYFCVSGSQAEAEIPAWTMMPEIPSSDEIMCRGASYESDDEHYDTSNSLPRNQIIYPWAFKEEYLETHYRLLREDSVAPLRDAVAAVRKDPRMNDSESASIYEKVHIVGVTYSQRGVAFRIRFSTRRAGKNIIWDYSKRLKSGSLVALSPAKDCFKTQCVVAVIAARPLENVKKLPPEVDIFFAQPEEAEFDPHKEWIMIEARHGYYEASRHTMTALQKLSRESFPFKDHLCALNATISPPQYIADAPNLKLVPVISGTEDEDRRDVLSNWPTERMADMDPSQWQALRQIITKRLAIVQGPPGTGKTFVSVAALKILLANKDDDDPPIIVAAQTNHALDQLLTHISRFESRFIRLGGRSNDLEIKRHTVHSARQKGAPRSVSGGLLSPAMKKFHSLSYEMVTLLQDFNADPRTETTILPMSFFVKHGVLSEAQAKSIEEVASRMVFVGQPEGKDPMAAWLHQRMAEFRVDYNISETFSFREDEIDLEYEQLKELEAEQGIGIEDDELEALKGEYCVIQERYIGQEAPSYLQEPADRYLNYKDYWKIPTSERGAVYNILRRRVKDKITADMRKLMSAGKVNSENLQIGKWEKDYLFLQNAKLIGMTTTGLSKYRALVSSLKPRVVLIEEAAEVIESSVTVACFESLQHLILVGDHKQLKGSCAVKALMGHPFNLDVSMFERLVLNEIPFITLQEQRRMLPEMRKLLEPIYGELKDHPSVNNRPKIPGMGDVNLFFFTHDWPENSDSLVSKLNEVEAQMVVEFFVYLVLNGVSPHNITVLTFYNGQRKKLLKLLREHPFLDEFYVKVVTVDSYQGEEDDIVLLSLVRSSNTGNIGFLATENRTCVSLSRAKQGLYIFGNSKCLSKADRLWSTVTTILSEGDTLANKKLGRHLPLTCERHGQKTFVDDPLVLNRLNGGCRLPCGLFRSCGHKCEANCHACSCDDWECEELCGKTMVCSHICETPCSKDHTCRCECEAFSLNANAEATAQASKPNAGEVSTGVKEGVLLPDLDTSEDEKEVGQSPEANQKDGLPGVDKASPQGQHEENVQKCNDPATDDVKEQDRFRLPNDEAEKGDNQSTGLSTTYSAPQRPYFPPDDYSEYGYESGGCWSDSGACIVCRGQLCRGNCGEPDSNPEENSEGNSQEAGGEAGGENSSGVEGGQSAKRDRDSADDEVWIPLETWVARNQKNDGDRGGLDFSSYDRSYKRGYIAGHLEGRDLGINKGFLDGFEDGFKAGFALRKKNQEQTRANEQNAQIRTIPPKQVIETSNDKKEEPKQSEQPVYQTRSDDLIDLHDEPGRPSALVCVSPGHSTSFYEPSLLD